MLQMLHATDATDATNNKVNRGYYSLYFHFITLCKYIQYKCLDNSHLLYQNNSQSFYLFF